MALKDFMAARGEGDEREDAGAARLPAASERRPHSALGYRPPAPEIIVPGKELPMNHEVTCIRNSGPQRV